MLAYLSTPKPSMHLGTSSADDARALCCCHTDCWCVLLLCVSQAVTAIADFLSFLFGRVDAASVGVRSGDTTLDEAVADLLAVALQRADSLKQSLASLPDAKMAQAAQQEVDAAVNALKQRLQVRQSCGVGQHGTLQDAVLVSCWGQIGQALRVAAWMVA
jgi:hypothetical protein